jgi:hypothetical protein
VPYYSDPNLVKKGLEWELDGVDGRAKT